MGVKQTGERLICAKGKVDRKGQGRSRDSVSYKGVIVVFTVTLLLSFILFLPLKKAKDRIMTIQCHVNAKREVSRLLLHCSTGREQSGRAGLSGFRPPGATGKTGGTSYSRSASWPGECECRMRGERM